MGVYYLVIQFLFLRNLWVFRMDQILVIIRQVGRLCLGSEKWINEPRCEKIGLWGF